MNEMVRKLKDAVKTRKIKNGQRWSQAWWNEECYLKKKETRQCMRKWRKGKATRDELKTKRAEYKLLLKNRKEESKRSYEEELKAITCANDAWKHINRERKKKVEVSKNIKLEEWKQHFMTLLEGKEEFEEEDAEPIQTYEGSVSIEEVKEIIKKMKKKKAAGEDGLKNEIWINGGEKLLSKVTSILDRIWKGEEQVPKRWKLAVVSPILKKGDKDQVENYRGVSLLDTSYKIYASLLNQKLITFLESEKKLPETQAGFRAGRGTTDQIYLLNQAVEQELANKRGKVYAMFADLKAAFDSLDRDELWRSLEKLGVNQHLIDRIKELYRNTKCRIRVNGEDTGEFETVKGVRQGCPLSATLFIAYIAGLEETLRRNQDGGIVVGKVKFWSLTYCDDVVLVAKDEAGLRSMLKTFKRYLEKKKMVLNAQKSKVLVFRKGGGREKKRTWMWGEEELEEVKEFCYLGYTFQRNNKSTKQVQKLAAKGMRATKQIWSIGERKFRNDFKIRSLMFDSIVKSIASYGCEIWGWKEREMLERLQLVYWKWVLGLKREVPGYIVLEETKRKKMRIDFGKRAMKMEIKTFKGKNVIMKEAMQEMDRRIKRNKHTEWDKERKSYWERNGIGENMIRMMIHGGKQAVKEVVERDEEIQRQTQYNSIMRSSYNTRYKQLLTPNLPFYLRRKTD